MKLPRILISAGSSGSGKTLITCGILQALINKGHKPHSFKCGPDYIDPMFHSKVIGLPSRNLDTFFADEKTVNYLMAKNSEGASLAVVEGVMGFYDGIAGISTDASTYDVARVTKTPVILVVPCKGMSLSVAALIKGFKEFMPDNNIKGVILNQASKSTYMMLKDKIEEECGVKVVGYVPKITDCLLESRHLGLVMPNEIEDIRGKLNRLAEILDETIDFEMLLELAMGAEDIEDAEPETEDLDFTLEEPVKIAVARDEAFCFMYEDNLALLEKMGAELEFFSPIRDEKIPEGANGLILYGGYPELYASELSENESMKESIKAATCEQKMPLLAECGGFMYLHDSFENGEGVPFKGVGVIDGQSFKTDKLGRFGYINLDDDAHTYGRIPAHEFHYYDSTNNGSAFKAQKPKSKRNWECIHKEDNMMVGFPHLYYYGNPKVAKDFLLKALAFKKRSEANA